MTVVALVGDTMLGRGVAEQLARGPVRALFGDDLLELLSGTAGTLANLECCISDRGAPWPGRVFHFRAPPRAVEALNLLGVRCVSLANNHSLDFGEVALRDSLAHLRRAGIAVAGAGSDLDAARRPVPLTIGGHAITVVSFSDHPGEYAAAPGRAGIAYADVRHATPGWLTDRIRAAAAGGSLVLAHPHWGPNMTRRPLPYVVRTAADLLASGAALIAGHSAHVPHGIGGRVLFDLGDFIDDYAADPVLRNDLGFLWLLALGPTGPTSVEAVPLHLGYCRTTLARGEDRDWALARLRDACRELGTHVTRTDRGLAVALPRGTFDPSPPVPPGASSRRPRDEEQLR